MMKYIPFAALGCALALTGCTTATVKTPEWEATVRSHWLQREVDTFTVSRQADGSYSLSLNGYKTDTSEQLPAFTREMWAGLGILGRLATATINPATASVPLSSEAASADDVAKLVQANASLKLELARLKAAQDAASCTDCATGSCSDGSCTD